MSERPATPVVLRPDPVVAGWWTLLGLLLVAAGVWLLIDSEGHPVAWVAFALFLPVAGFFLFQLATPTRFRVELWPDHVRAVLGWRDVTVAWEQVHDVRVRRVAGDHVLELHQHPHEPGAAPPPIGLLLPVGCDLAALQRFLQDRLGYAIAPPAGARRQSGR